MVRYTLVLSCFRTAHPQSLCPNTTIPVYHLAVSVGQEFTSDLAEWFWLSGSSEAQCSSWLGLQLKAGAGGSASVVLTHTSAC